MWIRSAFWLGRPRVGEEARFAAAINEELIPAMRCFPGVADVKALWPSNREEPVPDIHCQVIVSFASAEDMATMLASPERAALRPRVVAAAEMFDGTLGHIDYAAA